MGNKGQAFTEYIIAFFIFIAVVIFLFTSLFYNNQPAAQKIIEQSSNTLAQALAKSILEDAGRNITGGPNWHLSCNASTISKIGLSAPRLTYFVPSGKLDCLDSLPPDTTSDKFLPGAPISDINLPRTISAIPKANNVDCLAGYDATPLRFSGICNSIGAIGASRLYFSFGNTSRGAAELVMDLFFPQTAITIVDPADHPTENNDIVALTFENGGTDLRISAHVNVTDRDKFQININTAPDIVFIRSFSYKYADGTNVRNFTISNTTTLSDRQVESDDTKSFAAASGKVFLTAQQKTYGEVHRFIVVNASDGNMYPTLITIRTARRQAAAR